MEEKRKKSTKYLLIGTLVLFISVLGASMTYYLARISGNLEGRAAGTELTLNIEKISTSASDDLIPLDNDLEILGQAILGYGNNTSNFDSTKSCIDINGYSVCQVYKVTVRNNGTVPLDITGGVQLVGANTPNIDCAKMDTDSTITSNNSCKGADTLASNETLNANSSKDYYVLVYINNLDELQYDKGEFVGTVSFVSTQGKRVKARFNDTYNAASFIKDKFDSDTTKTNVDAADGVQYRYAPQASLMYDRLGGTTTELEDGNLRYYGANPSNYIDIGDRTTVAEEGIGTWEIVEPGSFSSQEECLSTMSRLGDEMIEQHYGTFGVKTVAQLCSVEEIPAGTPILWRIIGVFDNNLKIIRDESIGAYSYDTSSSDVNEGSGINEWSQSDIMKLLNPGYDNEQVGGSLWWNSESGTCYDGTENHTVECEFTNTGLSNDAKDLIVDNLWYLGGINSTTELESFASQYYAFERGNKVVQNPTDNVTRTVRWTGKVGLIYPSDYGYSTDLKTCMENLYNYKNSSICADNNWIKSTYEQRTISPDSFLGDGVLISWSNDYIDSKWASDNYAVRPSMYLKKDLVIESGTGTKDDPYIAG